eukprot:CAMPEP_0202727964 /NCGR_PEP_ID=MMETSP1385-20130828/185386_1 /ASSEMBLY_ACC=CAM_ASM_000861 /TAXON_ID=933848 /ORGANISM="Elphidium margaritaceum" /LENGTH=508 /DNA_ID=CAMNT_0049394207 /DNA_START=392 /DNA_END=1918 /DNA_ORIENTATION=-
MGAEAESQLNGVPSIEELLAYGDSQWSSVDQLMASINMENVPEINVLDTANLDASTLDEWSASLQNLQANEAMQMNGVTADELKRLFEINSNVPLDYDPSQCLSYISKAYSYAMAEHLLQNQTVQFMQDLKTQVENVSNGFASFLVVGLEIENVMANITSLITPILYTFDEMTDDYARCGFLGSMYGSFKQISCIYVYDDMSTITRSMMIISFLSVIAVLLALCIEYLFHPIKRLIVYRSIYADDMDDEYGIGEFKEADEADEETFVICPRCGYRFRIADGAHMHVHEQEVLASPVLEEGKHANDAMAHAVRMNAPAHNDVDWSEYKKLMTLVFYTFAGYLPWSKKVGLYMSFKEVQSFLDIVCIDKRIEEIFESMDSDIKDGRVTLNEFMEYFTDAKVNPECASMKQHIEQQVTWQLLVKSLRIFDALDEDRSGKLENNEFQVFGSSIGLDKQETEVLWQTMDTNQSGSIDIVELFTWFRSRLYQQKDRILLTREPTIHVNNSEYCD